MASSIRASGRRLSVFGGQPHRRPGVVLGCLVIVAAVGAPLISPLDPFDQSAADRLTGPDASHIMGATPSGRDIFARVFAAGACRYWSASERWRWAERWAPCSAWSPAIAAAGSRTWSCAAWMC